MLNNANNYNHKIYRMLTNIITRFTSRIQDILNVYASVKHLPKNDIFWLIVFVFLNAFILSHLINGHDSRQSERSTNKMICLSTSLLFTLLFRIISAITLHIDQTHLFRFMEWSFVTNNYCHVAICFVRQHYNLN